MIAGKELTFGSEGRGAFAVRLPMSACALFKATANEEAKPEVVVCLVWAKASAILMLA